MAIRFKTLERAIEHVETFADNLDSNVPIMLEDDGTYMFFGHGRKVATWVCGDKEDDLPFYGITREPKPTKGYQIMKEDDTIGKLAYTRC